MPIHQHITFYDRRRGSGLECGDVRFGELKHGVMRHVLGPLGGAVVGMRRIEGSD